MVIVEVNQIPTLEKIKDVPTSNLIEIYKTCLNLEQLCLKENGIGISAVQVGIPWRLFLVRGDGTCPIVSKREFGYFVNCNYDPIGVETSISHEGCLSLRSPDGKLRFFHVERYQKVKVKGQRLFTSPVLALEDVSVELSLHEQGNVFQHEADHSFGTDRLISNIGKEVFIW